MIKALFFDVDGTLVSFNTHKIPDSTIKALQMAHDKGVKIFTATGRPLQLLNNIPEIQHFAIFSLQVPCVFMAIPPFAKILFHIMK